MSLSVLFVLGLMIPNAFAESVPDWVKNTAGWWADDKISETEFVNAVEFLVKENIIQVSVSQTSETSQGVPDWVKNTAGWWATDIISEIEFVNAIAYLIKVGIINIESSESPELIAEMWINGNINDDEFLRNVEQLIEKNIITIQSDSITKTSQLPDWLVNNAGWWAARIFTNSDFDFDPGYVKEEIYPCIEFTDDSSCITKTNNSHGFRGNEFEKEKPHNTFRIFTVGGSTTNGTGAEDDETWPAHLQQIINEKITSKKIEVINAGIDGAQTPGEHALIKDKISSLDPDLIIMYDGLNDYTHRPIDETIQYWKDVCKLGKNEGFDTIIIVQPLPSTGHRVLTTQEIKNAIPHFSYIHSSQHYVDAFGELNKVCTKAADFRSIFDYVQEPVFWDHGHTMSFGNKIIAENVFSVISPIYFDQTYSVNHNNLNSKNNESEMDVVYAVGANLSGMNFDNLNLQNAVFDRADLSNTSFKNTNIDGARFVFANLSNSNLLDRIDLSNTNLAVTNLSNLSLKGKNLTGTILTGADLSNTNLTGVDLSGKDLTRTILSGADLSYKDLTGTILTGADLSNANLTGVDLSGKDLTGTILTGVDLSYKDLTGTILKGADLSNANLTGVDQSNKNLTRTILTGADLSNSNFEGVDFNGKDLTGTILTGADLSYANFTQVYLDHMDFTRTILTGTNLRAYLQSADLSGAANLTGVILHGAYLVDSNFEGVDLSPDKIHHAVFKNKAYLLEKFNPNIVGLVAFLENFYHADKKWLQYSWNVIPVYVGFEGNDLVMDYITFTSLDYSDLKNANFKNAELRYASFSFANLSNADLSGADLRCAIMKDTDLSNADLSGADLTLTYIGGANLSNANLSGANIDDALTVRSALNDPAQYTCLQKILLGE